MNDMNKGMRLAVIGAGSRGNAYSKFSKQYPERLSIVAVAEPRDFQRKKFAHLYDIPESACFTSWETLLAGKPEVDAVLIATPDRSHVEPAIAFAEAGYNILLEKPMASTLDDCIRISEAVEEHGILFGLCHVLLYTPHTKRIKEIYESGRLGDIVSIQRLEPVGFWHFAHSYVRGNWRREDQSSSVLMAKACHDIDWILHVMNRDVLSVSSFGTLNHFKEEKKPKNAAERCLECIIEEACQYSAKRFYGDLLKDGQFIWPLDVVIDEPEPASLDYALQNGPYGRCVYSCDNTVVDNQVVNLQFSDDRTASFSMMAFSDISHRKTRLFGSAGFVETDGQNIRVFDFLTGKWSEEVIDTSNATAAEGHGGGDYGLMDAFIRAWETGDRSYIQSDAKKGLRSHEIVFAAEEARIKNKVVSISRN